MARLILNSAVIPQPGVYEYRYLSVEEAQDWLKNGPYQSSLRYDETADAMEKLLGVRPVVVRRVAHLPRGDEALESRLKMSVSAAHKLKLTSDQIAENAEIGLLTRIK